MKQVEIFTDGACSGNPGPGGHLQAVTHILHTEEECAQTA